MIQDVLNGNINWHIEQGDCLSVLRTMPDKSVHCCVTSPPYWGHRDYGIDGQIGLEPTPEEYVSKLMQVFREVRRVLKDDGTVWLNLGDSYFRSGVITNGGNTSIPGGKVQLQKLKGANLGKRPPHPVLKQKDLVGIPWRVAFALQADGWYLRSDIIWHKPNAMPESVKDRPTRAHEYIFLLAKSERYYYDAEAIREDAIYQEKRNGRVGAYQNRAIFHKGDGTTPTGVDTRDLSKRNKRTVWSVSTKPFKGAHFAVFPPDLIEPCVLAGCPPNGIVLDPFNGAGTTCLVALRHSRRYIGIELNPEYVKMSKRRIMSDFETEYYRKDQFANEKEVY